MQQEKKKFFDPSLDEILEKVRLKKKKENNDVVEDLILEVSEDSKKKLGVVLEKANEEEKIEVINQADPNNNNEVFLRQYKAWARNNTNAHPEAATFASKVSFWLGSTFIQKPKLVDMPDYIWYLPKDRIVCFPDQFKNTGSNYVSKFILFTNKYIEEVRKRLLRNISIFFLVFGISLGAVSYGLNKVHEGYVYVTTKISSTYNNYKMKSKNIEDEKQHLITEANSLVSLYKEHKISEDEYQKRKADILKRQTELQGE